MAITKRVCINPKCNHRPLELLNLESTWTQRKYYCTNCPMTYSFPTTLGKAAQVSPLVLAGGAVIGLLFGDDIAEGFISNFVDNQ